MRICGVFLSAAALVSVASCGGSDPVGADGLRASDIEFMIEALHDMNAFEFNPSPGRNLRSQDGLAAQTGTVTQIDREEACEGGGTVRLTGTYSVTFLGNQGSSKADITQTHRGCASIVRNGRRWTFDGNPSTVLHLNILVRGATSTRDPPVTVVSGNFAGSVSWSLDSGKTGECTATLNITGNTDPVTESITGQIKGTACGRQVDVHY